MRFGTNLGNVVITLPNERRPDGRGFVNFLQSPPLPGAFQSIREIAEHPDTEDVFAIGKCKDETEILEWLDLHGFYDETGIAPGNVRFCREIEQKADIAKDLHLSAYVDDRPATFTPAMRDAINLCMLFGVTNVPSPLVGVVPTAQWTDVRARVL